MELRHLRYFVAIAEARSFTLAAERLWVAQPGLSTQIKRLEADLGVRLFERHTRGVDLTDAGELFLERARVVLDAADLAGATGRDIETGVVGTLRLGLPSGARWSGVAGLLEDFSRRHPAIEVTVVESDEGVLARELLDGRLDAFLAPSIFGSADMRAVRLGREPWEVLVGEFHDLAGEGPIAAAELEGATIVVPGHREGAGYDRLIADLLADLGVTAELRRGAPGPALLAAVAAGEAIALTTAPGPIGGDLSERPLDPERTLTFELFSRSETPAPALLKFISVAQEYAFAKPATSARRLAAVA